jgi:hypothetical protein
MRVDQVPVDVEVLNISETGFRARCPADLQPGDTVMIGAAGLSRREASVIWADAPIFGFQFDRPVSTPMLESIRQTNNVLNLPIVPEPSGVASNRIADPDDRTLPLVIGATLSLTMALGFTVKAIWDGMVRRRPRN